MLQRDVQHTGCANFSACGVWPNGHNRVTEMTRVKSPKVGTMLLRDCHANLYVITVQSSVFIGKRVSEQQVVERICDARNGPPRTQ